MSSAFYIIVILVAVVAVIYMLSTGASIFNRADDKKRFDDAEITRILLGLKEEALAELMTLHAVQFGKGPARYARQTLKKWKDGKVRPASRTFERFLVVLPKTMSYDLKCEVLRHFMEEYAAKEEYELSVTPDDWQEKLDPLIEGIINKAFTAQLPSELEQKLQWLAEGDMQAAQIILRSAQAEESRLMVAALHEVFESMAMLLDHRDLNPQVTHVLEFPYGRIKLNVKRSL